MAYFNELIRELGVPPSSPLGPPPTYPEEIEARRQESARLTELLNATQCFSFVRIGDMDLGLLLAAQEKKLILDTIFVNGDSTGTAASGCPGISVQKATRLREALEEADYVDFHERLWPVGELLPRLFLERPPGAHRNPSAETSYLLLTWMEHEFRGYCESHRVGFCGAEAAVLRHLAGQQEFQSVTAALWPENIDAHFHQPKDNGSNLDANLDEVKEDLRAFIRETRIDTLFLSLGGGAKILCYELAKEEYIRCIDFGAMLRALCYLGSDGNRAARSTHSPFYHRLPFDLVMDAVEVAFPNLTAVQLLAKAHAQVILEVQKKEVGWTSASTEYDFSADQRLRFQEAERSCLRRYGQLVNSSGDTRLERKRFLHFCGRHGLTGRGRAFYVIFLLKSAISRILKISGFKRKP